MYIERERYRERERKKHRDRDMCVYIYIYIHVNSTRPVKDQREALHGLASDHNSTLITIILITILMTTIQVIVILRDDNRVGSDCRLG